MKISAIDPSINSSGVVSFDLDSELNITSRSYLGFSDKKKFQFKHIIPFTKKQFRNEFDQNNWMYGQILNFVIGSEIIIFEGYSYSSVGKTFQIAEFCGGIKLKCYDIGIKIRIMDPLSVKLFSTGKGNSDKVEMCQAYSKLSFSEKLDLDESFFTQKGSPAEDIVDAFWMLQMLLTELKLRKGLILMKDLQENQIRVFNRVTKSNPVNLLDTPFLSKGVKDGSLL